MLTIQGHIALEYLDLPAGAPGSNHELWLLDYTFKDTTGYGCSKCKQLIAKRHTDTWSQAFNTYAPSKCTIR